MVLGQVFITGCPVTAALAPLTPGLCFWHMKVLCSPRIPQPHPQHRVALFSMLGTQGSLKSCRANSRKSHSRWQVPGLEPNNPVLNTASLHGDCAPLCRT